MSPLKACLIFHGLVSIDLIYQCLKTNLPDDIQFDHFNTDCLTDEKGFWHPEWVIENKNTVNYDGLTGKLINNFHWLLPIFLMMYRNYKKGKDIFYGLKISDRLSKVRKNLEYQLESHNLKEYDIVGINTTYRNELDFLFTVFWLKKYNPDALVICGGRHFSSRPELRKLIQKTGLVNSFVIGDGEKAFPWLISEWRKGHDVPFEVSMPISLSNIELPIGKQIEYRDFSKGKGLLVHNDNVIVKGPHYRATHSLHLYTTRGCSNFCNFCTAGQKLRIVKTKRVVDAFEKIDNGQVYLADSISGYSKKRFYDIHKEMKDRNLIGKITISFAYFMPKVLLDGDIIKYIAPDLNMHIHTGIESFCQDILERMGKNHTAEDSIKICTMLHKYGNATLGRMLCFPGETEKQFDYQVEMFLKYLPEQSGRFFYNFQLFPGTDIYNNPHKYDIELKYYSKRLEDYYPEMGEFIKDFPIDWIDLTDKDGSIYEKKIGKLKEINKRRI